MSFEDDLKAQMEAKKETAEVPFTLNKNPYVLRFTQLDPWEWAEEADRHPARRDVQLDRTFGYNMRELVKAVAPQCGELLHDGEPVEVRVVRDEKGNVIQDDWATLFKAMSPSAVQRMCSEVFALHEQETINSVVTAAKKALGTDARPSKRR